MSVANQAPTNAFSAVEDAVWWLDSRGEIEGVLEVWKGLAVHVLFAHAGADRRRWGDGEMKTRFGRLQQGMVVVLSDAKS